MCVAMQITIANPRGFCAGVEMAIKTLDLAVTKFGTPLYALHEIVHNQHVVDSFRKRGVVFVESVEEVPEQSTLLYSAHGVSPEVRNLTLLRKLRAIDATCPLVSKVHMEAVHFSREGFQIVYIGHKGHQEVVGTLGEAPECMHLVESVEDVEALSFDSDTKLAYLTQTTLSVDETVGIINKLKERFPHIVGPKKDDICYATQNRQDAVKSFSKEADLVLVVGSKNSSNSLRLVEVAKQAQCPAYLVNDASAINLSWFEKAERILITAGASAPERLVQECVELLVKNFGATVNEKILREEKVSFSLPKEVR